MSIKIALVGNPNSGKTTMFNALTGSTQFVGNWPGVTVEKKTGKLIGHEDVEIIDLPGIYSLSPYSLEEVISRNYIIDEKPDAIINIVDSTNLERNLYLTTQILELGTPVVIALNMVDMLQKKGDVIDIEKLGAKFGCDVIETSALNEEGCDKAAELAIKLANNKSKQLISCVFSNEVEAALTAIDIILPKDLENKRWYTIKLFEKDKKIIEKMNLSDEQINKIIKIVEGCEEKLGEDSESIITSERYNYIDNIKKDIYKKKVDSKITTSDKIDNILTNKYLGIPIFAIIMFLVYYISISTVGTMMTDWVNDSLFGEIIPPFVEGLLIKIGTAEWLNSLILDGIIGGVGAVLGFLPQMLVLFTLLAILEACGYMSRIAFIMDRIFSKFGLSGKSIIPMLIGSGCSVPGIMASRTIESESDRRITVITTSFIPCSAKLPIIALIAGAMFNNSVIIAPLAYFIGVAAIIISGIILKKIKGFAGDQTPFVMELPPYQMPRAKEVLKRTIDQGKHFVKKAGTIIFLACGVVWFLSNFNWSFSMVDANESILASLGRIIAPVFIPLGFGNWESAVATITGLVAKENVLSTFGVLLNVAEEVSENGIELWTSMQQLFTPLSAFSFLIFNLICAPCFAAIGAIRREMGNAKWTLIAIGYQTVFAYALSLIVYQLGMLFSGRGFGIGTAVAFLVLAYILYLLFVPYKKEEEKAL